MQRLRGSSAEIWPDVAVVEHRSAESPDFRRTDPEIPPEELPHFSDHGNDHLEGIRPGLARSKFDVLNHGHQHQSTR